MRIIATADWHIRGKGPRIRKDDYPEVQFRKVEWICDLANELDATIMVAGDIYDKPYCSLYWLNRYIFLLKTVKNGVGGIFGQHDIFYHNPVLDKTPFNTLLVSGAIRESSYFDYEWEDVSFGQEPQNLEESDCLLIHFPVTPKDPPFFLPDALSAKQFMDKYPKYQLIVSGDYHDHHITKYKDRLLVNPGPIMRSAKDKMDFKPSVTLIDTDTLEYKVYYIPIEGDVFDLDKVDKDDMASYKQDVKELAQNIKFQTKGKKYSEVLQIVLDEAKADKTTRNIVSEIMEKVHERLGTN